MDEIKVAGCRGSFSRDLLSRTIHNKYRSSSLHTNTTHGSHLDRLVFGEDTDVGLASSDGDRGRTTKVNGLERLITVVQAVFVVASAKLPPGVAAPTRNISHEIIEYWNALTPKAKGTQEQWNLFSEETKATNTP